MGSEHGHWQQHLEKGGEEDMSLLFNDSEQVDILVNGTRVWPCPEVSLVIVIHASVWPYTEVS